MSQVAGGKGDPAKGAKIFKTKCAQCHTLNKVRRLYASFYI